MQNAGMNAIDDEAHELISSARVEGTPIFDPDGQKLGKLHSLMIHKTSGQVAYALLEFGGLLGIGAHFYPVPWEMLAFNARLKGYVADISYTEIEHAPTLSLDPAKRPRESEQKMYDYWETQPYW